MPLIARDSKPVELTTRQGATIEVPTGEVEAYRSSIGPSATVLPDSASTVLRERYVADLLVAGRGAALCPTCAEVHKADQLRAEEASWDGIYRRRFFCPAGHLLLETPVNLLGEGASAEEYDWRPICS